MVEGILAAPASKGKNPPHGTWHRKTNTKQNEYKKSSGNRSTLIKGGTPSFAGAVYTFTPDFIEGILAAPVYRGRHHLNGTGDRKPNTNQYRHGLARKPPNRTGDRKPNTNQYRHGLARKPSNGTGNRKPNTNQHRKGNTKENDSNGLDPKVFVPTGGRGYHSFAGTSYAYTSDMSD
ncbi:hypothetical protein PSTT_01749 [Puccinia striiformis]|uniref:Uncharacterized protein n=2 Tax=Puccinia striiformis TaxID=27350 RepID=A0A2S4W2B1_9BASI|nr:hypothetical protein PSTT_01749 [Puccinia striiformis]